LKSATKEKSEGDNVVEQATSYASGVIRLNKKSHPLEGRTSRSAKMIERIAAWQFLRFCAVGASNALIDFGVLNLLLWLSPAGDDWKTLAYNSVAVLLASTNSFMWNKYWTFQKRGRITFQEISRFMVVAGGTMFINDAFMWLLGRVFPGMTGGNLIGSNMLKLGAIIGAMSISFFGMRLWVFFQRGHAKQ
jgi:putative flippase GtrA